jgi:hypothetical protein
MLVSERVSSQSIHKVIHRLCANKAEFSGFVENLWITFPHGSQSPPVRPN